jgi:probable HAF family extracellular repeat protein
MTSRTLIRAVALTLFAALASPAGLTAQQQRPVHRPKHHHYQLIDIGTFGGPESHFDPGSGNDFGVFTSVLNLAGTAAGFADTSISDPFQPICFWNCHATHAFQAGSDGSLTDLGALSGDGNSSAAVWISGNGLIAGLSENGEIDPLYAGLPQVHGVLWQQGTLNDLGTLPEGGYESVANSVNNAGQVVGSALNMTPDANSMQPSAFWLWGGIDPAYQYQTRAFLWDKKKGMQDIGTLPGGSDAQAFLINERGQVVGVSYTSSGPSAVCAGAGLALTTGSFIWDKKNGMRDLGNLGGTCTIVADLNNRGQVIGSASLTGDPSFHAFLWENGVLRDLGGSLGGDFTGAFVMNEKGHAVGFAYLPGNTIFHATLWKKVGDMRDLGVLGDDQCSYATGINAKGQVVGASSSDCAEVFRAFVWEHGSMVDLNTLIPTDSPLQVGQVYTINERGEIAGEGDDENGTEHAFLMIPCDEGHPGVAGCDYSMVDPSESATDVARAKAQKQRSRQLRLPRGMDRLIGPMQNMRKLRGDSYRAATPTGSNVDLDAADRLAINGSRDSESIESAHFEQAARNSCPAVRCSSNHTNGSVCGARLCHIPGVVTPIWSGYDRTYKRTCFYGC